MATAESNFGWTFGAGGGFGADGTNTYEGWKWHAGSESSPLQPGDFVILQLISTVEDDGVSAAIIKPVDPTTGADLTDWVENEHNNFVDSTTGYHIAYSVWIKEWQPGDDPSTYEALFTGYYTANTGWSEVNVNSYVVLGAGGFINPRTHYFDTPHTALTDPETYTQTFDDAVHSWEITLRSGFIAGYTYGYYPFITWTEYDFTGCKIFGMGLAGINDFASLQVLPSYDDSTVTTGADPNPVHAHTAGLFSVASAADIHIGGAHAIVHVQR